MATGQNRDDKYSEVTMKRLRGVRRTRSRVAREGHLKEGTFEGCFKCGVALARARQDGRRKVLVEWEGMKEGSEGYMWGFRQFTQCPWTLRE